MRYCFDIETDGFLDTATKVHCIILKNIDTNKILHLNNAQAVKKLEEAELNEWGEVEEAAEYQGRKVTLNKPTKGDVKKSKVYVKNEKGNVVKVEFGDPNMQIQKDIPARDRKSVV